MFEKKAKVRIFLRYLDCYRYMDHSSNCEGGLGICGWLEIGVKIVLLFLKVSIFFKWLCHNGTGYCEKTHLPIKGADHISCKSQVIQQ